MPTKNWYSQMMKRAGQEGLCTEEYEVLLAGKRRNYPLSIKKIERIRITPIVP